MHARIGVDNHCAKLQTLKTPAAKADALLLEKNGAWGDDFDCQANEATKWQQYGRGKKNARDVQDAFPARRAMGVCEGLGIRMPHMAKAVPGGNSQSQEFGIGLKA